MQWRARSIGCLLLALLAVLAMPAAAQSLESLLAPGTLAAAHAKWDDDCKACHVRFDRAAQTGLCMDCHKPVAQDRRTRQGYHGRLPAQQPCRDCHTDHKGRDARIAAFDARRFDHTQTDFTLRGAHATLDCAKCHVAGRKYSAAPSDCVACHRDADVHKGSLGSRCADCHTETRWREAKFDHGTTRFALLGRHATATCNACHRTANYRQTPSDCIACHRADDNGPRGHRGQYGERCESCHGAKGWKPSTFNHDTQTRYALTGQHRSAACAGCHSAPLFKAKPAQECVACHRDDDKHRGSLGRDCASCHGTAGWKGRDGFDHARTAFALLGRHATLRCESCHKSLLFKEAPKACIGCHRGDDRHAGTLGENCASCHDEKSWRSTAGRFDHDRTRFRLRNAHAAPLACKACHADAAQQRGTPTECVACHRKDDRHAGQQGSACGSCHNDASWKVAGFDHGRTRFALLGRHQTLNCISCHKTARFKDAPSECVACHRKDDRHEAAFGARCDGCHNPRAWSIWNFDHDKRSSFALAGAHRSLACEACHQRPAPAGRNAAPLASSCIGCHRKDDAHDGDFGSRCEQCHGVDSWKRVLRRGGAATRQPANVVGAAKGAAP